jgi:hypothetical protein
MIFFNCQLAVPDAQMPEIYEELNRFNARVSGVTMVGSNHTWLSVLCFNDEEQATLFLLELGSKYQARRTHAYLGETFTPGIRSMYIGG